MQHEITIPTDNVELQGLLHIPDKANGIVIFAHGSGSGRLSPRNQFVAEILQHVNLATLLFDLLTQEEEKIDERTAQFRFDINFLASRLLSATEWILQNPNLKQLPIGYFGASTGGGAAIAAAAKLGKQISAVVSRGGRPDLADQALSYIQAPTLLIIGSLDEQVIALNKQAYKHLNCVKQIEIINGATHLFEEPGKLAEVANLAGAWFTKYLQSSF